MEKYDDYDVLDFGTSLIPGAQIKIEHTLHIVILHFRKLLSK